jgi:pimeloyl-ACP methyl ester carboxylesterase
MHDCDYVRAMKSTIVRSERFPRSPRLVRAAGATLSALAPTLAARLSTRAFLTPPRYAAPARESAALATARPGELRVDGKRVRTWSWGSGPTILLVHGWGGRGAQLASFVEPLLARGFGVTALDAPAHGASDGRQTTIPQMTSAVHTVATAHGPVRGLVAHSIGAVVAARAMAGGLPTEAAVFLAPPTDLLTPAARFAAELGLSPRVLDLMRRRVEERVGLPWSTFDLVRLAPGLRAPLLVFHDRGDGEIPWQCGSQVAQAWPGARLETTDGLGHRRILRDGAVVAEAAAFIAAHALAAHIARRRHAPLRPEVVAV